MNKKNIMCSSMLASVVALTAGWSSAALAADATVDAKAGAQLEEVTVTARRIEENIQQVPVVVTAFKAEKLEAQDLRTFQDIGHQVVSLNVCCSPQSTNSAWMRGVPGVVGYFDDAPVNLAGFANTFDIESVQVLKGPQGTLFGISTNGGAVVITPKKPSDTFGGYVQVTGGTDNRETIEGALNVPIGDKLDVRVAAIKHHRDGYIHDDSNGRRYSDENYDVERATVLYKPTDNIQNTLLAQYYEFHNSPGGAILWGVDPNGSAAKVFGQAALNAVLAYRNTNGWYHIPGEYLQPYYRANQYNAIDTLQIGLGHGLTLKNIASFQSGWNFSYGGQGTNLIASTLPFANSVGPLSQKPKRAPQWTEELQLQGKVLDDKLNFTLGTFNLGSFTKMGAPQAVVTLGGTPSRSTNSTHAFNHSIYAQGTYDLSDFVQGLSFTAGGRYTWDYRYSQTIRLSATGVPTATQGGGEFKSPSYTFSLAYQVTPSTMFYVTNAKGYSSGGFNTTAPPQFAEYQPETLNNFEGGVKSTFTVANVLMRINAAAFYGLYNNVQISALEPVPTPTGIIGISVTQNAAKAKVRGGEIEWTVIPFKALELNANVGYTHDRYTQFLNAYNANGVPVSNTSAPFQQTPKLKYILGATYHLPVQDSWGEVSVHTSYVHESHSVMSVVQQPVPAGSIIPAHGQLDAGLTWDDILNHEGLYGGVEVTNITKNHFTDGVYATYQALGFSGLQPNIPREVNVRLGYKF